MRNAVLSVSNGNYCMLGNTVLFPSYCLFYMQKESIKRDRESSKPKILKFINQIKSWHFCTA